MRLNYMWGNARDCQLGVPNLPEVQPLPVKVNFLADGDEDPSPPRVISVAIGASHAMCLVSRQQIQKYHLLFISFVNSVKFGPPNLRVRHGEDHVLYWLEPAYSVGENSCSVKPNFKKKQ